MSRALLLMFGMFAGAMLTTQSGVNSQLRVFLGSPFRSALVNFSVGAIVLLAIVLLAGGQPLMIKQSSWWMWIGGLLGIVYVVSTVALAPRLGATVLTATLVAGQLTAAVVLDHFGLVGFRVAPVSWPRLLGIALLFLGVLLIQRR